MGKVCLSCGIAPIEPKKPMQEPEDCENCGGKEMVKEAPQKPEPTEEQK